MKHRKKGRILKRKKDQRDALLRSLMRAVILKQSIVTTEARAKEVRPYLERLISKEKSGSLSGHRIVAGRLGKDIAVRLRKDIMPKLEGRRSGFLRITKRGVRTSDATRMVTLSLVE